MQNARAAKKHSLDVHSVATFSIFVAYKTIEIV
jgi:hypothetical protein